MSGRIWFNVYVTVRDGRLDELKRVAKDFVEANRERPEMLSYEWFFTNEDQTHCQVFEIYKSADALLASLERESEAADDDDNGEVDYPFEITRMEVCGDVSDALRMRLDSGRTPIEYFDRFDGFSRPSPG